MPVNVIGTLKPKNNGKFPVAEAVDIKVTDNQRLDEALEIKADLSTVNFALGGKADNSDIDNLQAQINEIITPVTQDAEVQNARVDAEGITHTTLKERIDSAEIDLRNNIDIIRNSLITENIDVKLELELSGSYRFKSVKLSLDVFPFTVLCDDTDYSFYVCFYDSNNSEIGNTEWAKTNVTYTTYPANTAYIVLICKADDEHILNISETSHFSAYTKFACYSLIEETTNIANNTASNVNLLIKALNYGPQGKEYPYTLTKGLVHNMNYNTPYPSTNTAFSNLFNTIGAVNVKVAAGYKALVIFVDNEFFCGTWSEFNTGEFTVNPDTPYYCIELRKNDNSDFTIANLPENVIEVSSIIGSQLGGTCYVQPTGSDNNDGLSRSSPFATIQKAIDEGFSNIIVKEGIYADGFTLQDRNDVSIILDHYYDTFSFETDEENPKIVIDGSTNSISTGCLVQRCTGCTLKNIEIKNMSNRGFVIDKCSELKVTDCIAHDCGVGATSGSVGGFVITNTDADFDNCVCYNIGTDTAGTGAYHFDGFNIHGTGTTNFINCKAWNCMDDGISHHDACCGLIDGGEWYNCGKGGIASPTHGAKVNVSNVYCHNNSVGIYADNDSAVTDRGNIILSNCVCVNNSSYDMRIGDYYDVIAINCVYSTIHGAENITRYGIGAD